MSELQFFQLFSATVKDFTAKNNPSPETRIALEKVAIELSSRLNHLMEQRAHDLALLLDPLKPTEHIEPTESPSNAN